MTEVRGTASGLRCSGCGIALQSEAQDKPGYVPSGALAKEPVICQRCFRIKNYNESSSVTVEQDEFLRLLAQIGGKKALVIHIVDLFDFQGSVISGLQRFIGNNPVLLAVNKIDLLPKVTNWNKVRNWVQKEAKDMGLKVEDVVLCSAKQSSGFDRLLEAVAAHRGDRDVYVVGATNVGKSSLINRLIRDYSDLEQEPPFRVIRARRSIWSIFRSMTGARSSIRRASCILRGTARWWPPAIWASFCRRSR